MLWLFCIISSYFISDEHYYWDSSFSTHSSTILEPALLYKTRLNTVVRSDQKIMPSKHTINKLTASLLHHSKTSNLERLNRHLKLFTTPGNASQATEDTWTAPAEALYKKMGQTLKQQKNTKLKWRYLSAFLPLPFSGDVWGKGTWPLLLTPWTVSKRASSSKSAGPWNSCWQPAKSFPSFWWFWQRLGSSFQRIAWRAAKPVGSKQRICSH